MFPAIFKITTIYKKFKPMANIVETHVGIGLTLTTQIHHVKHKTQNIKSRCPHSLGLPQALNRMNLQ